MFSFPSDKYPQVKLLDHVTVVCVIFLKTLSSAVHSAAPVYVPASSAQRFPSPHPGQHFGFLSFDDKPFSVGVRRYLIVGLIFISLLISDTEHISMYLFAVCMSSLEKCLFRPSAHFLNGAFCFSGY